MLRAFHIFPFFLIQILFSSINVHSSSVPALIDGNWLAENKSRVVVLDVRTHHEYMNGHWPGARWAGFEELGWQVDRYGIPGYLPNEKQLAVLLGKLGLKGGESIVVIGSAAQPERIAEATRIVWSLMMAGFQQVTLLDGGIESLPVEELITNETSITSTVCNIKMQYHLVAGSNRVEGMLDNNGIVVDFRPTLYFEGYERNPIVPMSGTILDALGYPPERLLDKTSGKFRKPASIRKDLQYYDIPYTGSIVTFGDTGVWGALGWFVLHQLLHNPMARLYDGSMLEWIDRGNEVHDSTDDMGGPIG